MTFINLLPRSENITGADLTGSDGTANRTYELNDASSLSSLTDVIINGTSLMEGASADYTESAGTITFLNIVDNTDLIRLNYWIEVGTVTPVVPTSTDLEYATPDMLAEIIGIKKSIPSWDVAGTPSKENVGTGDNYVTTFYTDYKSVLSDSYTFYYGSDQSTTDELTETTHYTFTEDTGKIVLTTAGVTLVDTNDIFAEYSYIDNGMTNSHLINVLTRAEKEVDQATNSTFTDGNATTPAYPLETEIQPSEGIFEDRIITRKKPLKDAFAQLGEDLDTTETTITLSDLSGGNGFPSTGYIIVDSEVITYTGVDGNDLTGCSRGVLGTTAATHSSGDNVHSTILFLSNTTEGTAVTFDVQPWDTNMDATEFGLIYRFRETYTNSSINTVSNTLAKMGVANRIKIIYLYGYDEVPADITRLTLVLAKRQLIQDNIGKSMIAGRNEFRPEMFDVDKAEIQRIVNSYIVYAMSNT